MKLIPRWQAVLMRAWSVRFIVLAGLLSGLEVALPLMDGYLPIPQGTFAALAGMISTAALVARVVAQKGVPKDSIG